MQDDARVLELTWLAKLERSPTMTVGPFPGDTPERRLAIHLLVEGLAEPRAGEINLDQAMSIKPQLDAKRWTVIRTVLVGGEIQVAITHAGAVRRAELEQQLQTGRIKEPMELIWDGRHFRRDTLIALLDVTSEHPLVVAFLDLNDVKKVFNKMSHAVGDAAIRRYLELVADIAADRGDAYRLSGGADEVVLLLPRLDLEHGLDTVRTLLNALGRERIEGHSLRAAAGVVEVTAAETVDELKSRADREQERAKAESRRRDGRPSVLAWPPDNLEVIPLPEAKTITEQLAEAKRLIEHAADASSVAEALDSVPFEEWESLVEHALREQPQEAEKLLRWTARWHSEDDRRYNAVRILQAHGLLDEEFQSELLQHERDPETRELLRSPRG